MQDKCKIVQPKGDLVTIYTLSVGVVNILKPVVAGGNGTYRHPLGAYLAVLVQHLTYLIAVCHVGLDGRFPVREGGVPVQDKIRTAAYAAIVDIFKYRREIDKLCYKTITIDKQLSEK